MSARVVGMLFSRFIVGFECNRLTGARALFHSRPRKSPAAGNTLDPILQARIIP
jgi:hypothetical protein